MPNSSRDNILIEKLLKDDVYAFDKLFEIYAKKLFAFSFRYLKSETEAEELVQEVFIKVWEKRKTLKINTSFKSYLFTIAYNDILKYFRSKSYHRAYVREAIAISDVEDKSDERLYYASVLEHVNELIEKLPQRRKTIFVKSRKEGLSAKEIAEELGISPGTVDNNISEALKFLKSRLKNEALALTLYFSLFLQ
ncbi:MULTISPECIES: RNA polymerase sigma-70 factor [unclassified Saccharicrinis]|uniref:RNA polymerase sigma-70 factor n=1 Tax=unclassified Saccharicrinis TaxID=2646859 RepID=UPI003D33E7E2